MVRVADDAVIDLPGFSLDGSRHRQLRRKLRHAEQAEVTVMPCGDILPLTALAQVEAAWQADHGPAAGTTLGRFEPGYLAHQAVYTAWCGPRVVAFASFHRAKREWCLDLMRSCSDMPDGTMHSLIHAALTDASVDAVLADHGGQGFGHFKPLLGEALVETLRPISARFNQLLEDREALDAILARGAAQARERAVPTLDAAYRALGLVRG